jgi:thiamine kinase-like enzyme
MTYSQIEENLKTLLASPSLRILNKKGGGNSMVFCVESNDKRLAVKSYPPYAPGQRDRLAAELMVYRFFAQQNIPAVPRLETACDTNRLLVIDWIEGDVPERYSSQEVEQAIQFIQNIQALNTLPEAKSLPLAAEACLSLEIILRQIKDRLERLHALPEKDPNLQAFLRHDFFPALELFEQQAREGYLVNKINPQTELALKKRSLIPADFGFHNSIRDAEGKLFFFDFDYFGWDDPVKLLADILWHPKMQLTETQKQQFIDGISNIYSADTSFLSRFYFTWPLFGLRWVLILLNEFIPAFWQNRQHADTYKDVANTQSEAQVLQLQRAKTLLEKVKALECPYETS